MIAAAVALAAWVCVELTPAGAVVVYARTTEASCLKLQNDILRDRPTSRMGGCFSVPILP